MTASPPPEVITFGCRLNALESEVIRHAGAAAGLGDALVVNTCAVTAEAVRQARQAIRRLRRQHPERPIIVTGCAAQLTPEAFARMPEVDRVLGNREKLDAAVLARRDQALAVGDVGAAPKVDQPLVYGLDGRSRAFAQVQTGCDHHCTFCIVPTTRGPCRSIAPTQVVHQVRLLVERGYREVVLTGIDLCSYGADLTGERVTLGQLVRQILRAVPDLPRLRLSTLDPAAIDPDLFAALADEPRLLPYWHLSLQAMDDLVLKRMRRRHIRGDVFAVVERARRLRPEIAFGADLIAGFPTETEAMFADTLAGAAALGLARLHVFPYSPREGTPAARMPQVPRAVREERARRLRALGRALSKAFLASRVGAVDQILVETDGRGRCPQFAPVRLRFEAAPGSIVAARMIGTEDDHLIGERAA
ncbi:MAG: tRNA (N(6)-L-threonylcarbamoyladenosine(37)-C(2))-methylthiotransferase MtaB [Defluviicoccus sp.]